MFEQELAAKFKRIFDFDKVTYDLPSESREQEAIFVEVESVRTSVADKRARGRVTGKLHVFANASKLPYGYFSKRIAAAALDDTKDLFFFDFEENKGQFQNIAERALSFVYLFDSQYDPAIGSITSIDLSYPES